MPSQTANDWAIYITKVIEAAQQDGYPVWIQNECCGCSKMNLNVGEFGEAVELSW
jgi:hypothetical protein